MPGMECDSLRLTVSLQPCTAGAEFRRSMDRAHPAIFFPHELLRVKVFKIALTHPEKNSSLPQKDNRFDLLCRNLGYGTD